jgi:septal ring factor EnvC (AmiA/AmiB activator)
MDFMDKVKAAAQDAVSEVRKATEKAQTKVEEIQARRRMDDAARQLGYLIYKERTQGLTQGQEADRLINEMAALDAEIAEHEAASAARAAREATSAAGTARPAGQPTPPEERDTTEPSPPPPPGPGTGTGT